MSIFGERIAHPGPAGRGPNMVEVLSDYAKKDYVDEELAPPCPKNRRPHDGRPENGGGDNSHYTAMRLSLLTM